MSIEKWRESRDVNRKETRKSRDQRKLRENRVFNRIDFHRNVKRVEARTATSY